MRIGLGWSLGAGTTASRADLKVKTLVMSTKIERFFIRIHSPSELETQEKGSNSLPGTHRKPENKEIVIMTKEKLSLPLLALEASVKDGSAEGDYRTQCPGEMNEVELWERQNLRNELETCALVRSLENPSQWKSHHCPLRDEELHSTLDIHPTSGKYSVESCYCAL